MSKENLNFSKKKILLTRPLEDSLEISKKISKRFDVYLTPLLEIKSINNRIDYIDEIDIIIFTSKNGLRHFNGKSCIGKQLIFTIGDGTKELANKEGIDNVINVDGDLKRLQLKIKPYLKKKMKILHPTSQKINLELESFFSENSCSYIAFSCYESIKINKNKLKFKKFMKNSDDGIITLFSSKTADSFKNELISMECKEYCRYKNLIVLSKQIFNKVSELSFKQVEVTDKPNLESAIKRIEQFLDGRKS